MNSVLQNMLNKYDIKNSIDEINAMKEIIQEIVICGLSRGGAVANVAAAHIDRACEEGTINIDRDNVYAYTIAAPNAVIDGDEKEISKPVYDNIMNVIYEIDVFSMIGPQEYGFRKYGKIHMIPTIHISAKDMERIKKGKKPKDKSLTEEEIAKAKDITTEYYKIRYSKYPSEYDNIK